MTAVCSAGEAGNETAALDGSGGAPDSGAMDGNYDYIIIGSGSAGSALAYRLGEDGTTRVLVLEFGGSDAGPLIQMPAALSYPMNMKRYDWGYLAEPESALGGRSLVCPRGKVIGGSSSLNLVDMINEALLQPLWQEGSRDPRLERPYIAALGRMSDASPIVAAFVSVPPLTVLRPVSVPSRSCRMTCFGPSQSITTHLEGAIQLWCGAGSFATTPSPGTASRHGGAEAKVGPVANALALGLQDGPAEAHRHHRRAGHGCAPAGAHQLLMKKRERRRAKSHEEGDADDAQSGG